MISTLGPYTLKERLNADGGNTAVYRAVREGARAPVVLKVPNPGGGPDEAARIRAEYALLSTLHHPSVVRAVELVEVGGAPALALEPVPGATLRDALARVGRLELSRFWDLALGLCEALEAVHAARVIHLDVNPSNVMVDLEAGRTWLIDFGISTRVQREQRFAFNPVGLAGTLPYLAPEQTGRTNRSVDYRADLYALGCTFTVMLTGRPPFEGRDPLELVHQHVARVPPPLDQLRGDLPPSLARIVARLLAKNPEDRYQSAGGVAADLRRSRAALAGQGPDDFPLAEHDRSARFAVPEALLGREEEVARLLAAFDGAPPRASMVLVAGYSGVGKSRVVREIQRPVAERDGWFCAGKFDQFQRHVPFAALSAALADVLDQLLALPAERAAAWRQRLLGALDGNGAALASTAPGLEAVLGDAPPLAELPPTEARHRHRAALRALLRALTEGGPLAIFLDDLQWIDGATLEWLEETLADPSSPPIFLVGAYRDNEVDAAHPLAEAVDRLAKAGAPLQTLPLAPLSAPHVRALVASTLHRREGEVTVLAEVLTERTGGNPFFLTQLLESLHDAGAIRFDPTRGEWAWDAAAAQAAQASPNVVDLVVSRLERLPERTRELLFAAACLGSRFDSATLALASGRTPEEVVAAMEAARDEGFLVRVSVSVGQVTWAFLHDRVQQAAHRLVGDEGGERRRAIGWQMADAVTDARPGLLFGALQNLNPTRDREADRARLSALNLRAAREARRANAYAPAREHARIAAELAPPTFALAFERAWCEHLAGDPASAEAAFAEAARLATDDAEHAACFEARVHFFTDLARFPEAYAVGREGAAFFGHAMPASFVPPALVWDVLALWTRLRGADVARLVELPEMDDPRLRIGCRLAAAALKAAYQIRPELCVANAARLVRTCLARGVYDDAAVAFLVFGSIFQGGVLGYHAAGYEWGKLATALIDRYGNAKQRAEVLFVFGYFAVSWTRPLAETEQVFRAAWRAGQQSGDVFHASCATSGITQNAFMRGAPLDEVLAECDRFLPFLQAAGSWENEGTVRVVRQACRALMGHTPAPTMLAEEGFDEAAFVARLPEYGSKHFAHFYAVDRLVLAALAEDWDEAERLTAMSASYLAASVGMQHAAEHELWAALVDAERGRVGPVRKAAKRFRARAERCPENFRAKQLLLEAELERLAGRPHEASERYDRAAEDASAQGFRQIEGVAALRSGRLHLARGAARAAQRALREAIAAFRGWGASALSDRLIRQFPDLGAATWRTTTGGTRRASTTTAGLTGLDAASLLKAGEAIAAEVRLSTLLDRMLDVVAENAGAERVAMLLPDGRTWRVRAERDLDAEGTVHGDLPFEEHPGVAASVVQLALRTQRAVVVNDLRADDRFRADPRARETRSVLAVPLIHKQRVRGLIYLENRLVSGGFSPDRVAVLEMLAGPMAVSVENAELYEGLEDKVRERTVQLEQRNRLIRQTFGRYLSDDVVDTLLESPQGLALGGERRKVTILMSDLRGFVSLSDRCTPEQVVMMLNNYLSRMTRIIFEHKGTIDEFLGDAILVVFGAPFQRPDDEARAVRCALAMMRDMGAVNAWNAEHGLPCVEMGIGLHTGEAVVGNIGSEMRAKYGVVGQTVNLASRVESYTVGGQVLVSEHTAAHVPELEVRGRMTVEPKGARAPITILEVVGVGGRDPLRLDLPDEEPLVPLASPIPVDVRALAGKDVVAEPTRAHLVALSPTVAELDLEGGFEPLTNLRLDLAGLDGAPIDGLYGKVPLPDGTATRLRVRFTAVPPAARAALDAWTAAARGAVR